MKNLNNPLITILFLYFSITTPCFSQDNFHSILFDGSAYVDCGNDAALIAPTSPFTIMTWFKNIDLLQSTSTFFGSGITAGSFSYGYALRYDPIEGHRFFLYDLNDNHIEFPLPNCNDEDWHHFAVSADGIQAEIYFDGVPIGGVSFEQFGATNGASKLFLGGDSDQFGDADHLSKCQLDEFSIWTIALSHEQINNYRLCSPLGTEPDLQAFWGFNAGAGLSVIDESGNGWHGVISGAQWSTSLPFEDCGILLNGSAIDTDNDWLSDCLEELLGTNPLIQDTDGDGLTDGLEVNISQTNPLNPDTDFDGCTDDMEFSNQCGESGCTYPLASNYSSEATIDDGSCVYCQGDYNNDCWINTSDLLIFLQTFGNECVPCGG